METERMIRDLKYVANKYKDKPLYTGETDIHGMCLDVIRKLEDYVSKEAPPTLEDVMEAAFENNFICWYEEDLNRLVFGFVMPEFFVYEDKVTSAMPHTQFNFKNYELFDLGRRYLQSLKV